MALNELIKIANGMAFYESSNTKGTKTNREKEKKTKLLFLLSNLMWEFRFS